MLFIYTEGSQNVVFLSMKTAFVSAICVDPNEMLYFGAFNLGLHCLPQYLFTGFHQTRERSGSGLECLT